MKQLLIIALFVNCFLSGYSASDMKVTKRGKVFWIQYDFFYFKVDSQNIPLFKTYLTKKNCADMWYSKKLSLLKDFLVQEGSQLMPIFAWTAAEKHERYLMIYRNKKTTVEIFIAPYSVRSEVHYKNFVLCILGLCLFIFLLFINSHFRKTVTISFLITCIGVSFLFPHIQDKYVIGSFTIVGVSLLLLLFRAKGAKGLLQEKNYDVDRPEFVLENKSMILSKKKKLLERPKENGEIYEKGFPTIILVNANYKLINDFGHLYVASKKTDSYVIFCKGRRVKEVTGEEYTEIVCGEIFGVIMKNGEIIEPNLSYHDAYEKNIITKTNTKSDKKL